MHYKYHKQHHDHINVLLVQSVLQWFEDAYRSTLAEATDIAPEVVDPEVDIEEGDALLTEGDVEVASGGIESLSD